LESAALASSIFLVARKRERAKIGAYESEVRTELGQIVRERVETLWDMGIAGSDLIIATVGAGLRALRCSNGCIRSGPTESPVRRPQRSATISNGCGGITITSWLLHWSIRRRHSRGWSN
jgi:hypothetical protein